MRRRSLLGYTGATSLASLTMGTAGCITISQTESETENQTETQGEEENQLPTKIDGHWRMARSDSKYTGNSGGVLQVENEPSVTKLLDKDEDLNRDHLRYPIAVGEKLYLIDRTPACYSIKSGEKIWDYHHRDSLEDVFMNYFTPIISDNKLILGDSHSQRNTHIGSINAASGEFVWRYDFESDADRENKLRFHSACADDGAIYLLSRDGRVFSFSFEGNLLWKQTVDPKCVTLPTEKYYKPILISNERLVVSGTAGTMYVINPEDGEIVSTLLKQDVVSRCLGSQTTTYSAGRRNRGGDKPGGLALDDGSIFTAYNYPDWGYIKRVDVSTGEVFWKRTLGDIDSDLGYGKVRPLIGPVIGDESLYLHTAAYFYGNEERKNFFSLSKETGEKEWATKIPGTAFLPVYDGNSLYVASGTPRDAGSPEVGKLDQMTAVSTSNGDIQWEVDFEGYIEPRPIMSDNKLIVCTRKPHSVYILSSDRG